MCICGFPNGRPPRRFPPRDLFWTIRSIYLFTIYLTIELKVYIDDVTDVQARKHRLPLRTTAFITINACKKLVRAKAGLLPFPLTKSLLLVRYLLILINRPFNLVKIQSTCIFISPLSRSLMIGIVLYRSSFFRFIFSFVVW